MYYSSLLYNLLEPLLLLFYLIYVL